MFYDSPYGKLHYVASPRSQKKRAAAARAPLVLVAGVASTVWHWPPQVRHLDETPVYALDLPGHGDSEGKPLDTLDAYLPVLLDWADHLGLDRFVLGGHSMGSGIVLTCMRDAPDRLLGAVLVGAAAQMQIKPWILAGLLSDFAHTAEEIVEWSYGARVGDSLKEKALSQLQALDPRLLLTDYSACNRFDMTDDLADLDTPTLILCAAEDHVLPPAYSEYLHTHLPNSRLYCMEETGHMIQFEQPETVAAQLIAFLDELSAS